MKEAPQPLLAMERQAMVELQLRRRGIQDERVLRAMEKVPRHEFVSRDQWSAAYEDRPLTIPEDQTTSQPYIIAAMLQAAAIRPEDKVLEVGSGSGYQTALLAELAAQVTGIERHPALAESTRQVLERLGYRNVTLISGDGSLGAPEHAPFDVIIVSAAAPRVPPALIAQLLPGGRLVVPVGDVYEQKLQLLHKHATGITVKTLEGCRFVPLVGEQGFPS